MKLILHFLLFLPLALFSYELGDTVDPSGASLTLKDGTKIVFIAENNHLMAYSVDEKNEIIVATLESILINIDNPGKPNHKWRGVLSPKGSSPVITTPLILPAPTNFIMDVIVRFPEKKPESFHNIKFAQ